MNCRETLDCQVWEPYGTIIQDPKDTFFCWLLINIIFIGFGEGNWFIASLLTTYGLVALYVLGIYFLSLFIIRLISFPMSHPYALRSMEQEIARDQRRTFLKNLYTFRTLVVLLTALDLTQGDASIIGQPYWENTRSKCLSVLPRLSLQIKTLDLIIREIEEGRNLKSNVLPLAIRFRKHLKLLIEAFELVSKDPSNKEYRFNMLKSILVLELNSSCLAEFEESAFNLASQLSEQIESCKEPEEVNNVVSLNSASFDVYSLKKDVEDLDKQEILEEGDFEPTNGSTEDNELTPLLNFMPTKNSSFGFLMKNVTKLYRDYRAAFHPLQALYNIDFHRKSLQTHFNSYPLRIPLADGNVIDGILILGKGEHHVDSSAASVSDLATQLVSKKVLIVCNPNAAVYEYSHFQYNFLDLYLDNQTNIFLFNYRGYGRSSGKPTPQHNSSDAIDIVQYLISNKLAQVGSIGVQAMSIGGIMAAALCERHEEFGISLFVFDRNFATLSDTAAALVHPFTKYILRDLTPWQANNVTPFLNGADMGINQSTQRKLPYIILCCDPNDEIIHNSASLKVGTAREVIHRHIYRKTLYDVNCMKRVLSSKTDSELVSDADEFGFLQDPAFSIDLASNVFSIQTKLRGLYDNSELTIEQKQVATTVATIFKDLMHFPSGHISLQSALSAFLLEVPLETFEEVRKTRLGKANQYPDDVVRDYFNCLLVWQPYDKLMNVQLFLQNTLKPMSIRLRRLKINESEICESINLLDEVTYISNIIEKVKNHFEKQTRKNLALIPLNCGHNGNFRRREWRTFVSCLKESQWI